MKKRFLLILMLSLLLCGCGQSASQEGFDLPFALRDVVKAEAFDHNSLTRKVITDESEVQSLYSTLHFLNVRPGTVDSGEPYGVYSFRFHLKDGSTYLLVYEGYGVKKGILTPQTGDPVFTEADLAGVWANLKADAVDSDPIDLPTMSPDEEAIDALLQAYFDAKQQDFLSEEDISTNQFFTPLSRQNLYILPFYRVFRFEKLVRRDILDQILEETLELKITGISVDGDTAAAEAMETYTYQLADAEEDSIRQTSYVISLLKVEGQWKINFIETDNELIEGLIEGIDDVDAYFQNKGN